MHAGRRQLSTLASARLARLARTPESPSASLPYSSLDPVLPVAPLSWARQRCLSLRAASLTSMRAISLATSHSLISSTSSKMTLDDAEEVRLEMCVCVASSSVKAVELASKRAKVGSPARRPSSIRLLQRRERRKLETHALPKAT